MFTASRARRHCSIALHRKTRPSDLRPTIFANGDRFGTVFPAERQFAELSFAVGAHHDRRVRTVRGIKSQKRAILGGRLHELATPPIGLVGTELASTK